MERLTKRNKDRTWYKNCEGCPTPDYGFSCADCEETVKQLDKLADYEDAKEQERLIEFPVAIGDHLWEIEYYKELNISSIKEFIVNTLEIDSDSFIWSNVSEINPSYDYDSSCFNLSSLYGKCVFSSLEEAEAKLKEMEGSNE